MTPTLARPVEIVRDFTKFLSGQPESSGRLAYWSWVLRPPLAVALRPRRYPLDPSPANFHKVVSALGNPEALSLWCESMVTMPEAIEILNCDECDLITRVEAGEFYGLRIIIVDEDWKRKESWLFSRRRIQQLRTLDMMKRWATPEAKAAAWTVDPEPLT